MIAFPFNYIYPDFQPCNFKTMKKNYFPLLFIFTFFISNAQIVNIPDANFKARLLNSNLITVTATDFSGGNLYIDANGDGEIQLSEALQVKTLTINQAGIADLTGITSFSNLKELTFKNNLVSSLDLHGLNQLEKLDCQSNPIPVLDVTYLTTLKNFSCGSFALNSLTVAGMTNLEQLICTNSQLTSLNLAGLTSLIDLQCGTNPLQILNVNHLSTLKYLSCQNNSLSSIDVSNLSNLEVLYIKGNNLTALDVTHNPKLYSFDCSSNQLTAIDLSHNPKISLGFFHYNLFTELDLSHCTAVTPLDNRYRFEYNPNLTYVNVKNGVKDYIHFNMPLNCPNLRYVCIDEVDVDNVVGTLQTNGLTNIQASTYCDFTPGGNYNTINGIATIDNNGDGCNSNDLHMPHIRLDLTDGTNKSATFTDTSGNYNFYNLNGDFTLTPSIQNPDYFTITPASATVSFPTVDNSTQTQHFCIKPIGIHNDIEIILFTLGRPRPGFNHGFTLVYRNKGNQTLSGNINFNFDDATLDFVSASPVTPTQSLNNLSWNYTDLLPFESRTISFTLNLNGPTETPALNIGDILNFTATANPVSGDESPQNNVFHLNQTVVGSYDPNDKTCLEGNSITPDKIGDYLNYVIRFQNTGTHAAENVVVKDVIDITKLDISSLQLVASSHPQTTRITANKAEFIFENINLPAETDSEAGSHGFVAFKIKTKNTLALGDEIQNTANIYFDFNAPITTDPAVTRIELLNIHENELNTISMNPVPVKDHLQINALENIVSVEVFDIQGRLLQKKTADGLSATIDFTGKSKGVYLIKVYTLKGMKVQKIIKG